MIKILSVIIFFSLLMLLYKKYQVSVEKKKLMSYIVVINQDVKVTDHKKKQPLRFSAVCSIKTSSLSLVLKI